MIKSQSLRSEQGMSRRKQVQKSGTKYNKPMKRLTAPFHCINPVHLRHLQMRCNLHLCVFVQQHCLGCSQFKQSPTNNPQCEYFSTVFLFILRHMRSHRRLCWMCCRFSLAHGWHGNSRARHSGVLSLPLRRHSLDLSVELDALVVKRQLLRQLPSTCCAIFV